MAGLSANPPVRGTQLLVEHMSEVFRHPSLIAIEIAWRWLFGIPFLLICWNQAQQILAAYPLESSGFTSLDTLNPWVGAEQIAGVASYYQPHALAVARWLLPSAALAWVVLSALGRNLLLRRMGGRLRFRPLTLMVLQGALLILFACAVWGWLRSMQWNAAAHISTGSEPNLLAYFIWTIFLTLGFFTVFALASSTLAIAPLLALRENRSALSALGQSFRLGRTFTSKLAEINLVLGISKLALAVLAMVFSAAPLPFSDELGPGAMHAAMAAAVVFFLLGDDFFQVVRLKAFLEFWKTYRGGPSGQAG